jgi:hypothetical protein
VGIPRCKNRPFAELEGIGGGSHRVEVVETRNCGRGVHTTTTLEPGQWIMEYVGEIITQAEYESRVKGNPDVSVCFYGNSLLVRAYVCSTVTPCN